MAIYTRFGSEVDIVKVHRSRKGNKTIINSVDLRRKDGSIIRWCPLYNLKADDGNQEIMDTITTVLAQEARKD